MSNYTKTTDFEAKDSLPTGDSGKIIRGAEFETEFDAISTAIATKADTAGPTFTGTLTFETISDGTINVTAFVDEDDMSSDSATLVPTQQSVKAYVDSQVTAQDLDFQADTGGALSIDLDSETMTFTGGTGIDTSGSGNAVTFAIDSTVATLTGTQTLTNKTLTSPDVNTPDIDGGTIDGTVIGGTTPAAVSATTVSATGNITVDGTVDGRDVAADGTKLDGIESGATADQTAAEIRTLVDSATDSNVFTDADHTKLDGIEASADVTDTANVTAAGALMDSELTSEASVKALNQGVATTDSPTFAGLDVGGTIEFDGLSGTGSVNVTDILDQDDMSSNSATALATQQSIKAYVDSTVAATNELVEDTTPQLGGDLDLNSHDITGTGNIDVTGSISADGLTVDVADQVIINHSGDGGGIRIDSTNSTNTGSLRFGDDLDNYIGAVEYNHSTNTLSLYADNATRVAVDSSGIDVTGSVTADSATIQSDTGSTPTVLIDNSGGDAGDGVALKVIASQRGAGIADAAVFSVHNNAGEMFRVRNDGNVGIGTQSPAKKLSVKADGGGSQLGIDIHNEGTATGDDAVISFETQGSREFTIGLDRSATSFVIAESSTLGSNQRLVIDDSGNIGIGGSPSGQKFEVIEDSGDATMRLRVTDGASDQSFFFYGNYTGPNQNIYFGDSTNTAAAGIRYSHSVDAMRFTGKGNGSEMARFDSSGNFGVGTTSPRYNVEVSSSSNTFLQIASTSTSALTGLLFGDTSNAVGRVTYDHSDNSLQLFTNTTEKMRIDSSGNVGIGTQSPAGLLNVEAPSGNSQLYITTNDTTSVSQLIFGDSADSNVGGIQYNHTDDSLQFHVGNIGEKMRIDSSGNLLVGKTSTSLVTVGHEFGGSGYAYHTRDNATVLYLNRNNSDGDILRFYKGSSLVGSAGSIGGYFYIGSATTSDTFLTFVDSAIRPSNDAGNGRDNAIDLGQSGNRFKDIYATNGTIQTSDRNEKQDIEALSDAEQRVAVAAKGLLRKFRWKSAVEEKGDDARIHFGIIAQDLQDAFTAEGLDAGRYGMFINSTWTDEETGEERSRMGVRYSELLAFIISAI
jgi:hypothetical protein